MPEYGIDTSVLERAEQELDLTFNLMQDPYQVLLEDVYKTVTCPKGGCFWNSNTIDLRDYLMDSLSASERAALKTKIESLFQEDLRMTVSVDIYRRADGNLVFAFLVFPSLDPRPLKVVLVVDSNEIRIERQN